MNLRSIKTSAALLVAAALTLTVGVLPAYAQRGFSGQRGVTLFQDGDFGGASEVIIGDISDLRRSRIGADQASSLRIDAGCRAILYTDADFRGRSMEVTSDLRSLSGTTIGNDSVSSIRVDCRRTGRDPEPSRERPVRAGHPGQSGVTIFWRTDFHGRSHFFHEDHANLGATAFGFDQASSIILDKGCRVTLYAQAGFRGRSVTLTNNERQLGRTSVGDNTVRSLQVNCR